MTAPAIVLRTLVLPCATPAGVPVPGALVRAQLVDLQGAAAAYDAAAVDGVLLPTLVQVLADDAGAARLKLWPNGRGTRATRYRLQIGPVDALLLNALVSIPDGDPAVELTLAQVQVFGNLPPLSQVERLARQVQDGQIAVAADRAAVAADRAAVEALVENFDPGQGGGSVPARYTHDQATAAAVWTIPHNLGRRPAVTVTDRLGNVVIPDLRLVDANVVQVTHGAPMAGYAYCS